jgi:hypothetical protein
MEFYNNKQLLDPSRVEEIFAHHYIFNLPPAQRGEIVSAELSGNPRILRLLDEGERLAFWDRKRLRAEAQEYDALIYELPTPLTNFMRFEMELKKLARKYWALIEWNERILEFSLKIQTDFGQNRYIGLHIRRGDILRMLVEADLETLKKAGMLMIFQRFVSMKEIIASIRRLRQRELIVVCSDVLYIDESLEAAFGPENVCFSRKLFTGTENQQVIADIMLLANSKYLFAPRMSFFSICAETVGECQRIPLGADLAATVNELCEIANSIEGERRTEVIALIRETAAKHASSFIGFSGAG